MYTYKLKIKKVQGSLNESVRRNGITLRIKSAKKLSKNTLFEKADSYLNENYGVRLVEAKFRPRNAPARLSGNTLVKDYRSKTPKSFNDLNRERREEILDMSWVNSINDLFELVQSAVINGIITSDESKNLYKEITDVAKAASFEDYESRERSLIKKITNDLRNDRRFQRYAEKHGKVEGYFARPAEGEYDARNKKRRGRQADLFKNPGNIVYRVDWQYEPTLNYKNTDDFDDYDYENFERISDYKAKHGMKIVFVNDERDIEKAIIKRFINPKYGKYPKVEYISEKEGFGAQTFLYADIENIENAEG